MRAARTAAGLVASSRRLGWAGARWSASTAAAAPGNQRPHWLGPTAYEDGCGQDTIIALASGPGPCAIAVIRVAGPATDGLLGALCGWVGGSGGGAPSPLPPPRTATLVRVRDPATGATLDPAALALRFPGPASYTGGSCGELHVHGGPAVVDAVLRAATADSTARLLAGGAALTSPPLLRLAAPGEFTRRAVEAGKLDVASAEGVAALTSAVTEAAREAALPLATGEASACFEGWRAAAVGLLARTEACLEWEDDPGGASIAEGGEGVTPAEPLGAAAMAAVAVEAAALAGELEAAVDAGARCEVATAGARVALVGPPNAGKSSVLNALARRPAAIVASTPGTTRDVVEVALDVGGWGVVVADTAGLRREDGEGGAPCPSSSAASSLCPAELEGIARARAAARAADVRVAVVDAGAVCAELAASAPASSSPTLAAAAALLEELGGAPASVSPTAPPPPSLLVLNKWDLVRDGAGVRAAAAAAVVGVRGGTHPPTAVAWCSATTGAGIPGLASALAAAVAAAAGGGLRPGSALAPADAAARTLPIARARHRELVAAAAAALQRAAGLVECSQASFPTSTPPPTELVAEELRDAAESLGGIRAGRRVGTEELLGQVFARFCVGK